MGSVFRINWWLWPPVLLLPFEDVFCLPDTVLFTHLFTKAPQITGFTACFLVHAHILSPQDRPPCEHSGVMSKFLPRAEAWEVGPVSDLSHPLKISLRNFTLGLSTPLLSFKSPAFLLTLILLQKLKLSMELILTFEGQRWHKGRSSMIYLLGVVARAGL